MNIATGLTWGANSESADHLHACSTCSTCSVRSANRPLWKSGYNGSQSRKVANLINANAPIPGITPFATPRCPIRNTRGIQFLTDDGIGNYNGLGMKLSQRFGTNLTTLFSYTWSKSLDDGSAIRGAGNDFAPEDTRCRACEYGLLELQRAASLRDFDPVQPAVRQGPAIPESRRNREPGGGRLAGQHDHHAAERLPSTPLRGIRRAPSFFPNSNRINCVPA